MPPFSWLDNVSPCTDVYVFQAALLCSDCAEAVIEELEKEGQVDTGDSDSWPQGPHGDGGGEADSPQHCDAGPKCKNAVLLPNYKKIGCPLGNGLTSNGQKYVIESVARSCVEDKQSQLVGRLWMKIYDYLKVNQLIRIPADYIAPKLERALGWLKSDDHTRYRNELYTDLRHLYGAAFSDTGAKITLWRLELTANGGFTDLSVVHLPGQESPARTIEDMLDEAFAEDAWE